MKRDFSIVRLFGCSIAAALLASGFAAQGETKALGTIKATEYVVTAESDATAMAYATAVSNKLESGKQATLVSGTNIKTVNNLSLLGSGNITIEGGGSLPANYLQPATNYTDAATNAAVASAKAYADAAVVAATNGISAANLRSKTDLVVYSTTWSWSCATSDDLASSLNGAGAIPVYNKTTSRWSSIDNLPSGCYINSSGQPGSVTDTVIEYTIFREVEGGRNDDVTATKSGATATTDNIVKYSELTNETADVRRKDDNTCHAASYSEWNPVNLPAGVSFTTHPQPELDELNPGLWKWVDDASRVFHSQDAGTGVADITTAYFWSDSIYQIPQWTAKRTRIAASNDTFVTYSFVTNAAGKGGASISTNAVDALIANYDATNLTARINAKAGRITDAVYDFSYGTNFTRRLYETLTNLIDRFGGTVTNAPTFN